MFPTPWIGHVFLPKPSSDSTRAVGGGGTPQTLSISALRTSLLRACSVEQQPGLSVEVSLASNGTSAAFVISHCKNAFGIMECYQPPLTSFLYEANREVTTPSTSAPASQQDKHSQQQHHGNKGQSQTYTTSSSSKHSPSSLVVPTKHSSAGASTPRPIRLSVYIERTSKVGLQQHEHTSTTLPSSSSLSSNSSLGSPLKKWNLLVVGAGGIGCELLKDLALCVPSEIGGQIVWIHVIDLDTIDPTNLNRQFLFRKEHIGKPKASVAAEVIKSWPTVREQGMKVTADHGNIKDSQYDAAFFQQFSCIINGLDNVSARKHVNRMCMQAGRPLVESGTMGYNGQVQPIVKGTFECYDCQPKAADQKSFAVCTIHAKPTTMVHCVHYAKELYSRFFGEHVDDGTQSEFAFADHAFHQTEGMTSECARSVSSALFRLLFETKIREQLSIQPFLPATPIPADDVIAAAKVDPDSLPDANAASTPFPKLYNQFCLTVSQCVLRGRRPFSKDDDIGVNFVSAVSNLRASVFRIPQESIHSIRTIAGNIVPAIATTNAAIAACAVVQALKILRGELSTCEVTGMQHVARSKKRVVPIDPTAGVLKSELSGKQKKKHSNTSNAEEQQQTARKKENEKGVVRDLYALMSYAPPPPSHQCFVCARQQHHLIVGLNAASHTLASFVRKFLVHELALVAPIVSAGSATLYEHEDFEDLAERSMTTFLSAPSSSSSNSNPSTIPVAHWTVGDLNQFVEWTLTLKHDPSLDANTFDVDRKQLKNDAERQDAANKAIALREEGKPSVSTGIQPNNTNNKNNNAAVTVLEDEDDEVVTAYHPKGGSFASSKKRHRGGGPSSAGSSGKSSHHNKSTGGSGEEQPKTHTAMVRQSSLVEIDGAVFIE